MKQIILSFGILVGFSAVCSNTGSLAYGASGGAPLPEQQAVEENNNQKQFVSPVLAVRGDKVRIIRR